jgi:Ni/Fe-hydrogenase subunit HybB-like protein
MYPHKPVGGRLITLPFVLASLLVLVAAYILASRFYNGLASVTALNDGYPWGIWIVLDVMIGSAFGCAGYVIALLFYILNHGEYHPMVRPALLTSLFGYGMAGLAVMIDLGRYWQFYNIILPWNLNLNSVMLETALCIAAYTCVLVIEFSPTFLEHFKMQGAREKFDKFLFIVVAVGVLLPTMHQSSLGSILTILGHKLSPLWQTQMLPLFYLMTAMLMGLAVVGFESILSSLGWRRPLETDILARLAGVTNVLLAAFLILRVIDLTVRGAWAPAFDGSFVAFMFWLEMALMAAPLYLLGPWQNRQQPRLLFIGSSLLVVGGIIYRVNSYMIGFKPAIGNWHYFPTASEILVSLGMLALELVLYLFLVKTFPILHSVHTSKQG